jgi:arylsulfatase A-like enzyme/tetratricopeptide (TPR) repeat protein
VTGGTPGPARVGRLLLAALAAAAAALLASSGCSRKGLVFPRAPVFLISVDTLRADHLPAYGYRGVETPALDALAKDSLVFENAVSHVPLTLPSHVALLTGLLPFQNGVRDNVGYRLDASHTTLAEFLSSHGYAAGGAVSAIVLDHATGVSRGFAFWDDAIESTSAGQAIGQVQRGGGETERRLEAWISGRPAGQPVFALLHLYEPHSPYEPPEPFKSRYAKSPYDGEIAAADEIVERFVAFLKARGLYDGALVVFLSDHGEGLGDHGEDEHGVLLYREAVRVPLFLKLPKAALAGTRVAEPAGLVDVFPTIASALGQTPPSGLPGAPLLALATGKAAPRSVYSETLYPRYHFGWSDLASLTDDGHQYIEAPRPELYDFRADPGERKNLAADLPPEFRRLRVELSAMNRPLQAPGAADPETIKKLASLGYIGQASPGADAKDLPDPKDRIASLQILKDASRLTDLHRDDEAAALLREFTAENPRMLDGWESLARVLRRAGKPKEAIAALEQADRLQPGTPQVVMGLADLHLEDGQYAKARSLAEAARALGSSGVDEELAAIALAEGDVAAAGKYAEAAQAKSPDARLPLLLLGRVASRRGDFAAAIGHFDHALQIEADTHAAPMQGIRAARADALAHLGREKEAEEDFRHEIRDFPESLDAWSRLALLYAAGGRGAEFKALLDEMTRRVPTSRSFEVAAKVCEIVGDREGASAFRRRSRLAKDLRTSDAPALGSAKGPRPSA